MDALLPHANIKDGKVVSWKADEEAKRILKEENDRKNSGATPTAGGGTAPVISAKPIAVPADAIVNGKIDPKKMTAGQDYIENGKVRTWNGLGWQK
jgi:hypothetical protein